MHVKRPTHDEVTRCILIQRVVSVYKRDITVMTTVITVLLLPYYCTEDLTRDVSIDAGGVGWFGRRGGVCDNVMK